MADPRIVEKCKVTVAEDSMSATLFLEPPSDGIAYAVDDLADFVKAKGVYGGVLYSAIEEMTQNNIYYEDYVIARGTLPTEGEPGYFETVFDYKEHRTPLIRSDGSVDYQSMSEINTVTAGEKLIVYHPAKQGTHGVDVRGRALRCKPCKDLPRIKGVGFEYNDDTGVYTASVGGRIEYDGKTMRISESYEFKGDLDLVVGKIDFKGDVVIKGNVLSGTYIRATKSITIEGSVEAATIIAGGDIILKKGMQGGNKSRVISGGNIYANFLEFTRVEAKGNVEANIIMNCNVSAGNNVIISGKRGAIIGGTTYAVGSVSSTFLGNVAGHKTAVSVGISADLKNRNKALTKKQDIITKDAKQLEKEIIKVADTRTADESREVRAAKLSQLSRKHNRIKSLCAKIEEELQEIGEIMSIGEHAGISIANVAFAGSSVTVDDLTEVFEREYRKVEIRKNKLNDGLDIREG